MKFAVAALALVGSASALSPAATEFLLAERFETFKVTHSKTYESEEAEKAAMATFAKNVDLAAERNAKLIAVGAEPVHGITRFSDMTEDEFKFYLGVDATIKAPVMPVLEAENVGETTSGSFNWADEGMLTAVKDQAQCGSCWAFSATETIETAWAMAGNDLVEYAPQQMVSCSTKDAGCNGGMPSNAFEYVKATGGMCLDEDYPYTSGHGNTGTCKNPLPEIAGGTISKWGYGQSPCQGFSACVEDSDGLIANLKKYGPMSIAIDAAKWNTYRGGVMTSASCSSSPRKMDHAVQLVGYNLDAPTPYWIVRNSWATGWGEDGFIFLEMGTNTCGIANLAAQVQEI